jgi:Holliday junction DNA helicase RuvA
LIEFLQGVLVSKSSEYVVLQAGGVGFRLAVSAVTLDKLPAAGEEIRLPAHLHVREDEFSLYGFSSDEEKQFFQLLIQISGVGPKLALAVLSRYEAPDLRRAILLGDLAALTVISGVGKKTAERLILELKDKLGKLEAAGESLPGAGGARLSSGAADGKAQAAAALAALGYHQAEIQKALAAAARDGTQGVEDIIRGALRQLSR